MEIYSILRKKKIEALVKELGLENEDAVIVDCLPYEYSGNGIKFVFSALDLDLDDEVAYGNRLRALGSSLYSDAYDPSVTFSYSDEDTAELAYALARTYKIDLNALSQIELTEDSFYIVHSVKEIKSVISHRRSNLRTIVIFSADSYQDPHALASAFQNADIVFLIAKKTEEEKKFKKAVDRVIFSPAVKRLSAIIDIARIDDALPFLKPDDAVFEIELRSAL